MPEEWKDEWELSNECCKPCPFPDLEAGITEKKNNNNSKSNNKETK